jgi:deazaflavin-dependent oxidoreductase (nitroreductase family)
MWVDDLVGALRRIGNLFVSAVLRSRFHRLLSRSVMLLTFRGRRTGRSYRTPVMFATAPDGNLILVPGHPERKQWWRNLRHGAPVQVQVQGRVLDGHGEVVDDAELADAERVYLERFPRARPALRPDQPVIVKIRISRS